MALSMRRALRSTVLLTCVVWATLLGRTSFTCLQHRVYSEWLRSKGAAVPPENWLAKALLYRAQRLGLSDPLRRRVLDPYLPGGPKMGCHEEMYALWRAAGLFEEMRAHAAASAEADLTQTMDYDKFMNRWITRLRYQLQPWPPGAKTPLNFAIETFGYQMEDPAFFQLLENHTEDNLKLKEEMEDLKASVPAAELGSKQAAWDFDKLKNYDSLFVGHSNVDVENPYKSWEDVSIAICRRFAEKCKNPLYNYIGFYHSEDFLEDLFDPKVDLEKLTGQFDLIAGVHLILNEQMLQRLRPLLKPGGVILWNTWFRHEGEYPGLPPDLGLLGFEAMKDEELPLSFVSEPFQQAGFKFRFCYTQKTDQSDETLEVASRMVDVTPVTPITVKRQKTTKKGFA